MPLSGLWQEAQFFVLANSGFADTSGVAANRAVLSKTFSVVAQVISTFKICGVSDKTIINTVNNEIELKRLTITDGLPAVYRQFTEQLNVEQTAYGLISTT